MFSFVPTSPKPRLTGDGEDPVRMVRGVEGFDALGCPVLLDAL
jgi:hypothetical protein